MMRAMSLTQPWCGLMAAGIKLIENRNQPLVAAKNFGEPFGLHAARPPAQDEFNRVINRAIQINPNLAPRGPYSLADSKWFKLAHHFSGIIATAVIERVIKAIDFDDKQQMYLYDPRDCEGLETHGAYGDQCRWMFGRFCYVFKPYPIVLPTPVKTRGWQGFWTMPDDAEAQVRAQLAEAA